MKLFFPLDIHYSLFACPWSRPAARDIRYSNRLNLTAIEQGDLWLNASLLFVWGLAILSLAIMKFRKRLN